jgi:hypothetical protein
LPARRHAADVCRNPGRKEADWRAATQKLAGCIILATFGIVAAFFRNRCARPAYRTDTEMSDIDLARAVAVWATRRFLTD